MNTSEFDDELGVAGGFMLGFVVAFTATAVVGAAIAWHAISYLTEAIETVFKKL